MTLFAWFYCIHMIFVFFIIIIIFCCCHEIALDADMALNKTVYYYYFCI